MSDPANRGPRDSAILADPQATLLVDLSRRYRSALWGFFEKRVRERSDLEDLVQEVFARLARRSDLGAIEQIEGYLFQTAANLLRDRARRLAVRGGDPESFEEPAEQHEDITPERVLQGKETLERVILALHELPERTRAVFILHRFEELRYQEIARRLGISMSTVEKHMMKAIAHITRRLGQ